MFEALDLVRSEAELRFNQEGVAAWREQAIKAAQGKKMDVKGSWELTLFVSEWLS